MDGNLHSTWAGLTNGGTERDNHHHHHHWFWSRKWKKEKTMHLLNFISSYFFISTFILYWTRAWNYWTQTRLTTGLNSSKIYAELCGNLFQVRLDICYTLCRCHVLFAMSGVFWNRAWKSAKLFIVQKRLSSLNLFRSYASIFWFIAKKILQWVLRLWFCVEILYSAWASNIWVIFFLRWFSNWIYNCSSLMHNND